MKSRLGLYLEHINKVLPLNATEIKSNIKELRHYHQTDTIRYNTEWIKRRIKELEENLIDFIIIGCE